MRNISKLYGRRWLLPVDPPIRIVNRIGKVRDCRLPWIWPSPVLVVEGMGKPIDRWRINCEEAGHLVKRLTLQSLIWSVGRGLDPMYFTIRKRYEVNQEIRRVRLDLEKI